MLPFLLDELCQGLLVAAVCALSRPTPSCAWELPWQVVLALAALGKLLHWLLLEP